ncbi:ABC transporter ATP-binding protein [Dethiosulfatarculus sandiegensis]|uniref:Amino acid ABC transporter ATPase n=1 Tax=Dethiosulfatarculus sandiegensis TaxID=1429043 RepID=A0A0D2J621_9BACT|nr:ABC transporter ATP-binding protein [Dethiosulfatarculus sandiegensis]KIX11156.1 amino acid ABC transporter ATPase [Dethiosulfatarculus sandiegensis]
MLLEINNLKAGYGNITILHGVNLEVNPGEIVCLIGPNGAGKSTVLRTVAGQLTPSQGEIIFEGQNVSKESPEKKGVKGLIFIPQGENIFPNLSLLENLEIAAFALKGNDTYQNRLNQVLGSFPWMKDRLNRPAKELSGGQRQALALSRIILLKPKLVLLDEPSLGLAPLVVEDIFSQIQAMNQQGISFLMVEQNARKGLSVSHRAYVLEQGKDRLTGTGAELLCDQRVQDLYLGG